jgi:heavy metal sensor kinase
MRLVLRQRSVSLRLTVWFSAVFLIGLLLFGVAMCLDLAFSLRSGRIKTLRHRAERLSEVAQRQDRPLETRAREFDEFAKGTPEGWLIQVFDTEGNRVLPAPPAKAESFPWPKSPPAGREAVETVNSHGDPYLVLVSPLVVDGRAAHSFVAGQLHDNDWLLMRFIFGLLATIPGLFLLSAAGGYLLSRRALRPVDRLTASARSISINNLSGRLPVSNTGDELQRLAETCNEMLARLEGSVNQMKQFTADASHELRNPISFARTLAECALLNPGIDPESRRTFEEIVREFNDAGALLDDMLTLARADAGNAEALAEHVDLAEVVHDTCERARALVDAHGHHLSVRISDHPSLEIRGDLSTLRRLFWILLDNAVKYTPPGGRIEVRLRSENRVAHLSVSDTGVGIPNADLPRVFDRFYRADPSRSQVKGTGLGLAIAQWITQIHHAKLSVQSELGTGSTFEVTFPLVTSRDNV